METEDAQRLLSYLRQGGRLLMTRAHLTVTDRIEELRNGNLTFEENALSFCNGAPEFRKTTVGGEEVSVCVNTKECKTVLAYTDDHLPLICVYPCGKGELILFNTKEYPSAKAIRGLYEAAICRILQEETAKEAVWAKGTDNVEFAVYTQDDGSRHVYFLATDWYTDPTALRCASLRVGTCRYTVSLPFGVLIKAVSDGETAAWPQSEEGEVLSVSEGKATVQGSGTVRFCLARNGNLTEVDVDFAEGSVQTLSI
jgi:hypothetical protein